MIANPENLIRDFLREDLPPGCQVHYKGQTLIVTVSSAKDLEGASLRYAWEKTINAIVDCCFALQGYANLARVRYQCGDLFYPEFSPAQYAAAAKLYYSALRREN